MLYLREVTNQYQFRDDDTYEGGQSSIFFSSSCKGRLETSGLQTVRSVTYVRESRASKNIIVKLIFGLPLLMRETVCTASILLSKRCD